MGGTADTEPTGALNQRRQTTATAVEDGDAYLITGQKVHIGNGSIADLLCVTATVNQGRRERVRLFFVDTSSPGFKVRLVHEFMGLKGFPNAALTFDRVRVPKERMLVESEEERLTPSVNRAISVGRLYLITAPGLAIAKLCAEWSRAFVCRRVIRDRPLMQYAAIQQIVSASLCDVYAIESIARWCLLSSVANNETDVMFEEHAAKNIASVKAWEVVDRTMSLLASEGFETAWSKARRGAPPVPVERYFRDARGLRISGGVDFYVDYATARYAALPQYYELHMAAEEIAISIQQSASALNATRLSSANRRHLNFLERHVRVFERTCRGLAKRYPNSEDLYARQQSVIYIGRFATELLTMTVVLARTCSLAEKGIATAQLLAHLYCAEARHRLADLRRRLSFDNTDEWAELSDVWAREHGLSFLTEGIVPDTPAA